MDDAVNQTGDAVIEAVLGQAPEDNPLGFMLCDLLWNTVQLALTLPLDTTKRRMQLAGGVKVCVCHVARKKTVTSF